MLFRKFENVQLKSGILALLDCPICLSTLSEPKQLQCGHTFCQSCLKSLRFHAQRLWEQLADGGVLDRFNCPQCRQKINADDEIATNYALKTVTDYLKTWHTCTGCSRVVEPDMLFVCQECSFRANQWRRKDLYKQAVCAFCMLITTHAGHTPRQLMDLLDRSSNRNGQHTLEEDSYWTEGVEFVEALRDWAMAWLADWLDRLRERSCLIRLLEATVFRAASALFRRICG